VPVGWAWGGTQASPSQRREDPSVALAALSASLVVFLTKQAWYDFDVLWVRVVPVIPRLENRTVIWCFLRKSKSKNNEKELKLYLLSLGAVHA